MENTKIRAHSPHSAPAAPLLTVDLPGIKKVKSGKVREMFDLDDCFLMVATDRISAFDCIMPNGIPRKGEVLTQLSHFWFDQMKAIVANHRLALAGDPLPPPLKPYESKLVRRTMMVRKAQPLSVECVVRGYLAGSGWKEYQQSQTVCGIHLPAGLVESSELPEPIFTPATKAATGHDLNISFEQAARMVGVEAAEQVRALSVRIYRAARRYAQERGIIIADTKFEFGYYQGSLILIDEVLTPDSSRYWPADQYAPGRPQPSFDKQFLRDFLERGGWSKAPPPPSLPAEVIQGTADRYQEALRRLTI